MSYAAFRIRSFVKKGVGVLKPTLTSVYGTILIKPRRPGVWDTQVAMAASSSKQQATEPYLADATLQVLGETRLTHLNFLEGEGTEGKKLFKAKDLWRDSGALVLAVRRPG